MTTQRFRCALSARKLILNSLFLFAMVGLMVQPAAAGMDMGTFDLRQPGNQEPVAWVYVEDDTSDGSGVHYVAYHQDFVFAGAQNPTVVTEAAFQAGESHSSLQEFLDWIEATYSNVEDSNDLVVRKFTITTVQ